MPAPPAAAAAALDIAANADALDALYPCSDGKRMAESVSHGRAIVAAAGDLEAARPDALVAADILVYPEEGNPDNRIAPGRAGGFRPGEAARPLELSDVAGGQAAGPGAGGGLARHGAERPAREAARPRGDGGAGVTGCSTRRASCTRAGGGGRRASRWRTASASRWKSTWRGGAAGPQPGLDLRAEGGRSASATRRPGRTSGTARNPTRPSTRKRNAPTGRRRAQGGSGRAQGRASARRAGGSACRGVGDRSPAFAHPFERRPALRFSAARSPRWIVATTGPRRDGSRAARQSAGSAMNRVASCFAISGGPPPRQVGR